MGVAPSRTSPHDITAPTTPGRYTTTSPPTPLLNKPQPPLPPTASVQIPPPRTSHSQTRALSDDHHPPHPRKFTDNPQERLSILSNLLASEREYVQSLTELYSIYIVPGSKPLKRVSALAGFGHGHGLGGLAETVLPSAERKAVFDPLERITAVHRGGLLPALESAWSALSSGDDPDGFTSMSVVYEVAGVLEDHAGMLGMCYGEYGEGVWDALGWVRVWRERGGKGRGKGRGKDGKRVVAVLEAAKKDPRHGLESLERYVELPLHRIAHYEMFLKHLARNTPPQERSRRDPLDSALAEISPLARSMAQVKRLNQTRSQIPTLVALPPSISTSAPPASAATTAAGASFGPPRQPRLIMDSPLTLLRHLKHETSHIIRDSYTDSSGREHLLPQAFEAQYGTIQFEWQDGKSRMRHVKGLLCSDQVVLLGKTGQGWDGELEVLAVLGLGEMREVKRCGKANTFLKVVNRDSTYFLDAGTRENAKRWRDEIREARKALKSMPGG
ncbi:hypothetical protein IAT38_001476 [Cryptococcus sp. DSM 104549]